MAPGAGTGRSDVEIPPGRGIGALAKRRIGIVLPVLVAAIQQVKDDGAGHDGHPCLAHGKAAPVHAQPLHHAITGGQSKGRATRKHQRIDL